jgi:hypothetical protein
MPILVLKGSVYLCVTHEVFCREYSIARLHTSKKEKLIEDSVLYLEVEVYSRITII